MSGLRAVPLMFVMLTACERTPSAAGGGGHGSTATDGPQVDGGSDGSSAFSMRAEPVYAASLTSEMFDGVVPPRWHLGDTWEVMFCRRRDSNANENNQFDTTRVIFRVVAPPRPGAVTAVVTVQERIVPSRLWVRRPQEYDGKTSHPQVGFDHVTPWPARSIVFNSQTFDPVLTRIQTQGGIRVAYDQINDDWSTYHILACTPHVPPGLLNPEILEAAHRADRRRTTVTPTPEGLFFELQEGDPFMSRRVVFWRRGEPWWSFARVDTINVDAGIELETSFDTSEDGAVSWAVTLPPGQPDSVNCNSRR